MKPDRALAFIPMMNQNIHSRQGFPGETTDHEPPVVSSADLLRLRQWPLSDELADEIDRAIVVPQELVPDDVVTMHTRCTYIDEVTGTQREIELVYPDEADPARGRISVLTPVGSALLGLRVGQEIAWNFPDGSVRCLKIASVNRSPR